MNNKKLSFQHKISLCFKMVIGSSISWELAILFGSKYPYLAPISLILCLQATLIKSIRFGIARIVGTIIGGVTVSILAPSLHANGWSIAIIMLVSLIIPLILGANATSLHQIALSVLLVLEFEHKLPGYGIDRIRDSIIGVVVALLLLIFIHLPNLTKGAIAEIEELPNKLAYMLKSLGTWLEAGAPHKNYFNEEFNQLRNKLFEIEKKINQAQLSVKFNPLLKKSKQQIIEGDFLFKTLKQMNADIEVLFKIMEEWRKSGSLSKEVMKLWVQNFLILEASLRNWNEEKAISDVLFNETFPNDKFYFTAIWHGQHLISTLKQSPRLPLSRLKN
ncbi:FUSC family protein [Neobacillus vireti]|uniref:Integral membrane bound transporter domain-containing protein n=1 Tax=Neobacillus vireti LMG 21834 TaxID=1131730 RepID=A0AB94IN17_9BACI|nr:FUSC family protein [Neobacillus vireti]ETI68409.1 hypothetical protein BAVI_13099 [Neobacillus vireti LMG 21834]KLT16357.1 hypothetical protein AA980_17845 [Neobacillus vireti]